MNQKSKLKAWWTSIRNMRVGKVLDGCRKLFDFSWKTGLIMIAVSLVCYFVSEMWWDMSRRYREVYYAESFFGNGIMVKCFADGTCYTYDVVDDKRLSPRLDWVSGIPERDSLTVFCDQEGNRGFLNVRTGKIEIEGQYRRAWHFSEGLAAVQGDDGRIGFINHDNELVIPMQFKFYRGVDYIFRNGSCVMLDEVTGLYGTIGRDGEWQLAPEYKSISPIFSGEEVWLLKKSDNCEGLADADMEFIFEPIYDEIDYETKFGTAYLVKDGYKQHVTFHGEIIESFVIDEVCPLYFPVSVDELGDAGYEIHPYLVKYYIGENRCGLMNSMTGQVIIPAVYYDVELVSENLVKAEIYNGVEAVLYTSLGKKLD